MIPKPIDPTPLKVLYTDPLASLHLSDRLGHYLRKLPSDTRIAVVCLGTDRSTGDALGPLAGTALSKYRSPLFDLYGTLEEPVHALNLDPTLERMRQSSRNPFVIGVDACLGKSASVGSIMLGEGPIHPGAGVNKKLTPVGDVHVSGVVNIGGFMDHLVLQSTRLHVVMSMADVIARGLFGAIRMHANTRKEAAR
ncbi:spore protease YyaC [Cohnella thermotolerans]|uniref:spore protease YyaC n=1 Tax=Cohnella thermotolerans TaxID=329858 RepID=UPI00040AE0B2|nr:spore protease YyaC [Cohnella thermotolerans]